jgi:phosphopantetheine adenylyltransferase
MYWFSTSTSALQYVCLHPQVEPHTEDIVADAKLLEGKEYQERIQSYDQRANRVASFVASCKPELECVLFALTDPNVPTRAETDASVGALICSEETVKGAQKINEGRKAKGFNPMVLVVVPVIGAMAMGDSKLSSTALRRREAESGASHSS